MQHNPRLVSKLDEAIAIVRKQRRGDCATAIALGQALRERFGKGRPFEIRVGEAAHTIKPDAVRISKSRIDLGPVELPLMAVTDCQHGKNEKGDPIYGPGVPLGDTVVIPVRLV